MKTAWSVRLVILGCVLLLFSSCDSNTANNSEKTSIDGPQVFASNFPLQSIAKSLLGGSTEIGGPTRDVVNPRDWNPSDETIEQLQQAKIIFTVGADYEAWLQFVTLPENKVNEIGRSLFKEFIDLKGEVHKHGPEGEEHAHTGIANYFWLDPRLAMKMVESMETGLADVYPQRVGEIEKAAKGTIQKELNELGAKIDEIAESSKGTIVFTSDPRFLYLTRRLGWTDIYFRWTDHGKEELPADAWGKLDKVLETQKPLVMIFPIEPSEVVQAKLSERKIKWIVLDSLESQSNVNDDFLTRFAAVVHQISTIVD